MVVPFVSSTTALERWSTMRPGNDCEEWGDTRRPARNFSGAGRRGEQLGHAITGSSGSG